MKRPDSTTKRRGTKKIKPNMVDMLEKFTAIDKFVCKTLGPRGEYTLVVSYDPTLKEVGVVANVSPLNTVLMLNSALKEVGKNPIPEMVTDPPDPNTEVKT